MFWEIFGKIILMQRNQCISLILPIVTVERSTPHVVVSSDVTARAAAAAGLLVPVDDNGNHECCVRSYGSLYLCLKYLLALWW